MTSDETSAALLAGLRAEVPERIAAVQRRMAAEDVDALVVYGNNKVTGGLYYLSGYYPDRAGWVSTATDATYLCEGAAVVVPREGEPTLILDTGLTLSQEPAIPNVVVGGFTASDDSGLTPRTILAALGDGPRRRIGVETWDRFPTPLYLGLADALPDAELLQSRIVEELRLVKSEAELKVIRSAAGVADAAHARVVEILGQGGEPTELELIRAAEDVMRRANPIYEDSCSNSPSMISSGTAVCGVAIHAPQASKRIARGDVVHWDLCMRHLGYGIDTARTRCVGDATAEQEAAYAALMTVYATVVDAARPGTGSDDLVAIAAASAREQGRELWAGFLGHGVGIDVHERPDMGVEALPLEAGMVLALEPRFEVDGYLLGHEDLVVVTEDGGEPLMQFPRGPLSVPV